jgi:MFS family permease
MLVASIWMFLIGSWLCGLAGSILQMSIARAIAGIGGGGIWTLTSVTIHDLIPMRKRGQYQSYMNMSQTVSFFFTERVNVLINVNYRSVQQLVLH